MRVPGFIIIAALLALAPASAQQQGSITGVVRDQGGRTLPGVWVAVTGVDATRVMAVTDAQGRYTVSGLQPGTYALRFHLPGFVDVTTPAVAVTNTISTPVDAEMRVGQSGEPLPFPRPVPPLVILPQKPGGYGGPECVHGVNETDAERLRRQDAFNAMRLIYSVLQQVPADGRGFPDWPTLSRSSAVAALKKRPGPTGELANKIAWGSFEPLPGWRLTYVPGISVTYALRDTTDPCGYTLSSNDPHVIPPIGRTMPLS